MAKELVQKLVSEASFDARGVLVPAGQIGMFDPDKLVNEAGKEAAHLHDVGDFVPAVVEIAPIAPTGPNPTQPQQIPPGAVQGPGGEYMIPGKQLVGEVTHPKEERIDDRGLRDADREDAVNAKLEEIMGTTVATDTLTNASTQTAGETLTDGTVDQVTADLGTKTDDQLNAILTAEKAGKNRTGVVGPVQAELDSRKSAK